jgi:hypothetical protein
MTPAVYTTLFAGLVVALAFCAWVIARHRTATAGVRKEIAADERYSKLAEEYRRLSDMAISAQEHFDLRLADMSVRIDEIRDQLNGMRRILEEVE